MSDLISTREAADILNVHQTTVQRWIRDGLLVGVRIGSGRTSSYAVRREDVSELRRQREKLSRG